MSYTFSFLTLACLAGQGVEGASPPHQPLWTCSSALRWHNRMTCHPVEDVSLPFLDCLGRVCAVLTPRCQQQHPVYYGVNMSVAYDYGVGPRFYVPECAGPVSAVRGDP